MNRIARNPCIDPDEQAQGPRSVLHNIPEYFVDIVGEIQWRPGEGMAQEVPHVRAGVNEDLGCLALSWQEGEDSVVITLSKPEFDLYESRGDIVRVPERMH